MYATKDKENNTRKQLRQGPLTISGIRQLQKLATSGSYQASPMCSTILRIALMAIIQVITAVVVTGLQSSSTKH